MLTYLPHDAPEPAHGSVVLSNNTTGTAYQRFFSDGLWHPTTGKANFTWKQLQDTARRYNTNVILIHDTKDFL
jgi:hypothetical protein